jgi:hypothetical protein
MAAVTFPDDQSRTIIRRTPARYRPKVRAYLHFEKALDHNDVATCLRLMDDPATAEFLIDWLIVGVEKGISP